MSSTISIQEARRVRTSHGRRVTRTACGDLICMDCGGSQKQRAPRCFKCGSLDLRLIASKATPTHPTTEDTDD